MNISSLLNPMRTAKWESDYQYQSRLGVCGHTTEFDAIHSQRPGPGSRNAQHSPRLGRQRLRSEQNWVGQIHHAEQLEMNADGPMCRPRHKYSSSRSSTSSLTGCNPHFRALPPDSTTQTQVPYFLYAAPHPGKMKHSTQANRPHQQSGFASREAATTSLTQSDSHNASQPTPTNYLPSGEAPGLLSCSPQFESNSRKNVWELTPSPQDSGYVTSPTDSLTAFASLALAGQNLAANTDFRKAQRSRVRTDSAVSSVEGSRRTSLGLLEAGNYDQSSSPRTDQVRASRSRDLVASYESGVSKQTRAHLEGGLVPAEAVAMCQQPETPNLPRGASNTVAKDCASYITRIPAQHPMEPDVGNRPSLSRRVSTSQAGDGGDFYLPGRTGLKMHSLAPSLEIPSEESSVSPPLPYRASKLEVAENGPRCSYTEQCTTGSPLRKVVSHIFGRNKLCTRQIPKGVWVHYCRKHYQRSRYRNPRGFALLQCDLVRKQIDRLQLWGGVIDWMIKVRKREAERLNRENAELAAARFDGSALRSPQRRDHCNNQASNLTLTGSWRWLVQCTGGEKCTAEILRILDRIEEEIARSGSNFPDVEILPNVLSERAGTISPSSDSRRTSIVGDHVSPPWELRPRYVLHRCEVEGLDPVEAHEMVSPHHQRKRKTSYEGTQSSLARSRQHEADCEDDSAVVHRRSSKRQRLTPLVPSTARDQQGSFSAEPRRSASLDPDYHPGSPCKHATRQRYAAAMAAAPMLAVDRGSEINTRSRSSGRIPPILPSPHFSSAAENERRSSR